ncbi:hypothetical protein Riv7116_6587 [Rivularia sp. PCC 7116]|uniref:hypothetical protein n=1 Tax=Rivularia sp. PCC 7116 TaxID=373994 RepID=UPI00029F4303|nr:hypothetical protein [Rivularia sp. PCC 7116]AFY58914.1 hypothetical protein Riv7116_6587 [Rivularia sp. PCC 7116]
MFENKKQVVSGIVALSGTFVTPDTAQASLNRSNLNFLVKTTQKSAAARQASDALNKVKATKKVFDFVKKDVEKAINKATNIRNDALKKVHQAEEIAKGAKEDWDIKMIIAKKKLKECQHNPEKKYLLKQLKQVKEDVEQAKQNFETKQSIVAQKKLQLQHSQETLAATIEMQDNRLQAAKKACEIAQTEQQNAILYATSYAA